MSSQDYQQWKRLVSTKRQQYEEATPQIKPPEIAPLLIEMEKHFGKVRIYHEGEKSFSHTVKCAWCKHDNGRFTDNPRKLKRLCELDLGRQESSDFMHHCDKIEFLSKFKKKYFKESEG